MKIYHVVTIVLNAYLGPTGANLIHGSHGEDELPREDYLLSRLSILGTYTLPSLALQTCQDFHVCVLYDQRLPAPNLGATVPALLRGRVHFVGVPPIDFKRDLDNAFWKPRPAEDALIEALYPERGGVLLITHIDSDDCYRYDALARFRSALKLGCTQDGLPFMGALVMEKGYIHNVASTQVARYEFSSPPFYSLAYSRDCYLAGERYHGGPGHHSYVRRMIPHRVVDGPPSYLVNVHWNNDSTRYGTREALSAQEATAVRRSFGLVS